MTRRRMVSTGDHLPWALLPFTALVTGAGMLFLLFFARYY